MTADIAISTYKHDGIKRLAETTTLPLIKGVRYVISWQAHDNAPIPKPLADREDVTIIRYNGQGQSNNRNNALDNCTADIIIISDDDLIYRPENIQKLIRTFENNPDLDLATFRSVHDPNIEYPDHNTPLSLPLPKNYYVSCFEIALRRGQRTADLRFHPDLGLNSPAMHGGEDEVFLLSAIKRGLDCRFIPLTICEHPNISTGHKASLTPENLRAMGCVIALYYTKSYPLRLILKAYRLARTGRSTFPRALRYLTSGALKARKMTI